jgi:orotate phosphoribosyltransferase
VVIEDLISTGKSSLLAVEALKASGAEVLGMIAIFTYGFEHAQQAFDAQKVTLNTLSDYAHLIERALAQGVVDQNAHQTLLDWRKNPAQWGQ